MGIAADIALILVAALFGGIIAQKLGQPLLIGYILAGVIVGPYTAGPTVSEVHDLEVLAEIGVALLLFALGLEFNFQKILKVKKIAFIGAPIQIALSILVGWFAAQQLGWSSHASLWVGCIVALSSTMVILKTLAANGETGTLASRIMISMLVVQDLAVVPMLLILPELNKPDMQFDVLLWAAVRASVFLIVMIVIGTRVMPFLLRRISEWGSRELFLVAIMAIGLGVGYATFLVGLSFAFGAFVAGMVLSESEYSHQALSDIVPLRDIFGMIFFVTVGMLINPVFLWEHAGMIAMFVGLVVVCKAVILGTITRLFGYRGDIPITVALGLFQIGEFAFVLSRVAYGAGALDEEQYNFILATTLVTMMLTPAIMRLRPTLHRFVQTVYPDPTPKTVAAVDMPELHGHAIVVGYGRVGRYTAQLLQKLSLPFVVIESDPFRNDELRNQRIPVVFGDGAGIAVLHAAGIEHAKLVLIAVGSAFDVESIARQARAMAPHVPIVARVPLIDQVDVLHKMGIHEVVQPEFEAGLEMMRQTLLHFDVAAHTIEELSDTVRAQAYRPIVTPQAD